MLYWWYCVPNNVIFRDIRTHGAICEDWQPIKWYHSLFTDNIIVCHKAYTRVRNCLSKPSDIGPCYNVTRLYMWYQNCTTVVQFSVTGTCMYPITKLVSKCMCPVSYSCCCVPQRGYSNLMTNYWWLFLFYSGLLVIAKHCSVFFYSQNIKIWTEFRFPKLLDFCVVHLECLFSLYVGDSLVPGRSGCDFENAIFNVVFLVCILRSSSDSALTWMSQDRIDDKSTLVQVMA